jgi:hypothetical protein
MAFRIQKEKKHMGNLKHGGPETINFDQFLLLVSHYHA